MKLEIKMDIEGLISLDDQRKIEDSLKEILKDFEPKRYELTIYKVMDGYKRG
jgi:hypothetical protein